MLIAALSWLGRQGTRATAALVILGIALPSVGMLVRPYVSHAVFALLVISFLRIDVVRLAAYVRRPSLVLLAVTWSALAVPLLFAAAARLLALGPQSHELFIGLMLQGITSPMMAAPALAALMGLDATLVLITMVASTVLVPLTAPVFAHLLIGPELRIEPWALAHKLLFLLAGSAFSGVVLRKLIGAARIERYRQGIDGVNIIVLYVFVAAIMGGVAAGFAAAPGRTLLFTAIAFAASAALLIATVAVFWAAGRRRAVSLGFTVSQRNLGLMLAAAGSVLPEATWLYIAVSQLPIYLSPQLLKPCVKWMRAHEEDAIP